MKCVQAIRAGAQLSLFGFSVTRHIDLAAPVRRSFFMRSSPRRPPEVPAFPEMFELTRLSPLTSLPAACLPHWFLVRAADERRGLHGSYLGLGLDGQSQQQLTPASTEMHQPRSVALRRHQQKCDMIVGGDLQRGSRAICQLETTPLQPKFLGGREDGNELGLTDLLIRRLINGGDDACER